ncbi:hypothetical protein DHEL01_v202052 [Diaporthe helianthi]|uniref:Uncharacterized protein n=1 Tax=Diaporthe helianthi TaxID=158607 RepID=A0A2P5IAN5_DIAHE|nr:hypothetical protein DHEL01_v202052 [Diaporthe helianthi]
MKSTLVLVSLLATSIASPLHLPSHETRSLRLGSPELVGAHHTPIARQVIDDIDEETGAVDFENDEDDDGLQDQVDPDDDNDGILDTVDPDDDNDGEPDAIDDLDRRENEIDLPDIPDNIDLNPFDKH